MLDYGTQYLTDPDKLARAEEAIRARLQKVCSHLTDEDFAQLVHKIAIAELKPSSLGAIAKEPWPQG